MDYRRLTEDDLEDCLQLIGYMHAEGVYKRFALDVEKCVKHLCILLGNDGVFSQGAFIENIDGTDEMVGFCLGENVTDMWVDVLVGCDHLFYVRPDYRKGWTGVKLIRNFEVWSQDNGASLMRLSVFAGIANERVGKLLDAMQYDRAGSVHLKGYH